MSFEFSDAERRRALELAELAAQRAGAVLLEHFGRLEGGQVRSKDVARDLVSVADVQSERAIVALLREHFPEHAIEAEEEVRDAPRAFPDPRWYLDPLDGTTNFVHGIPFFAVSIGLWVAGRPEVAVVHAPRLDELFRAAHGHGAQLNGAAIRVSQAASLREALLATGFPYKRETLAHSNLENFCAFFPEIRGERRLGSAALDLSYTAAGRLDGYWELHLAPHDVAAGGLIVREAGGVVRDADGGEDWLRGGSIVAAGPALFESIRSRLRH